MLNRLNLLVFFILIQKSFGGGGGCISKPEYYNKTQDQIIIFDEFCDQSGQETIELPKGVPSSLKVFSFDQANFGRAITNSFFSFELDGNIYFQMLSKKDKKTLDKSFQKKSEADFKELIEFYKKRDFEKIEFIALKRNEKLSHSNEGKAYKYYEIYDWPDSNLKLGWKMKIQKGKIEEAFQIFGLKDGKEIEFYQNQREPQWTFAGGKRFSFYTDSKKSFLLAMFSDTWGGTYYLKTQDFPAFFK